MSFLPLKAGGWAFGEVLTSAQMNQLNTDFPFAIDGRSGGTYTPSGDIRLNSIILSASGQISGTSLNSSDFAFVSGVATLGFANIPGGADIVNGLTVDNIVASGTFSGLSISLAGSMNAVLDVTAGRRLIGKHVNADVLGVDADHTYLMTATDAVYINALTANRNWTIDTTGASDGERILLRSNDSVHTVTLTGPFAGGGTIPLGGPGGGGARATYLLTLIGGQLYILAKAD